MGFANLKESPELWSLSRFEEHLIFPITLFYFHFFFPWIPGELFAPSKLVFVTSGRNANVYIIYI